MDAGRMRQECGGAHAFEHVRSLLAVRRTARGPVHVHHPDGKGRHIRWSVMSPVRRCWQHSPQLRARNLHVVQLPVRGPVKEGGVVRGLIRRDWSVRVHRQGRRGRRRRRGRRQHQSHSRQEAPHDGCWKMRMRYEEAASMRVKTGGRFYVSWKGLVVANLASSLE